MITMNENCYCHLAICRVSDFTPDMIDYWYDSMHVAKSFMRQIRRTVYAKHSPILPIEYGPQICEKNKYQ